MRNGFNFFVFILLFLSSGQIILSSNKSNIDFGGGSLDSRSTIFFESPEGGFTFDVLSFEASVGYSAVDSKIKSFLQEGRRVKPQFKKLCDVEWVDFAPHTFSKFKKLLGIGAFISMRFVESKAVEYKPSKKNEPSGLFARLMKKS